MFQSSLWFSSTQQHPCETKWNWFSLLLWSCHFSIVQVVCPDANVWVFRGELLYKWVLSLAAHSGYHDQAWPCRPEPLTSGFNAETTSGSYIMWGLPANLLMKIKKNCLTNMQHGDIRLYAQYIALRFTGRFYPKVYIQKINNTANLIILFIKSDLLRASSSS